MRFLFLLFVIVPLIEIVLLINVGEMIGAWYTIGLVLLSAFIGVNMLRRQGLSTLMRARSKMDGGEIPAHEMVEGIILAVGGALLVTPGFVTDFFGFCCLIPFTRHAMVAQLRKHFTVVSARHSAFNGFEGGFEQDVHQQSHQHTRQQSGRRSGSPHSSGSGSTYEGEFRRDD